ncbi:MAG: class I SAM-dependent methyltransferase [Gammaproteobacteria bacterium]
MPEPVIETHAEVAAAYDQLAERWLDTNFPPTNGLPQHERALAFLAGSGGYALNVGCGASTRFNARLRERGLTPEGVDPSSRMVALARAADPTMAVYHADVCTWEAPRTYRFITAWDSLWHVRLDLQRTVLLKLMAAMAPGGVLVFTAGGLDGASEHHDAHMGPSLYYATLGIPGLLGTLADGGCLLRHMEFDQWPERHLVVVAQRVVDGMPDGVSD